MNPTPGKGIQVNRHRSYQGLSFACLHLGNLALVEHDPTYKLDIIGPEPQHPPGCLSCHCKGLRKQFVQRLPFFKPFSEFRGLCLKLCVRQGLYPWFKGIYALHNGPQLFDFPLMLGAKYLCN